MTRGKTDEGAEGEEETEAGVPAGIEDVACEEEEGVLGAAVFV